MIVSSPRVREVSRGWGGEAVGGHRGLSTPTLEVPVLLWRVSEAEGALRRVLVGAPLPDTRGTRVSSLFSYLLPLRSPPGSKSTEDGGPECGLMVVEKSFWFNNDGPVL